VDTVVRSRKSSRRTYYHIFKYCEPKLENGGVLYLYRPIERESGGALFYLGRNCPHFKFKTSKLEPGALVLLNKVYSEQFIKAGFKLDKEFKLRKTRYWIMKYER
jgi:hypothetical protein